MTSTRPASSSTGWTIRATSGCAASSTRASPTAPSTTLEAELRRRAVALIEAMPENEPFDFVARFSRDLPLQAICLLLGVPQEDRAQLAEWVDAGVAAPTPEIIAREYARRLRDYGAA